MRSAFSSPVASSNLFSVPHIPLIHRDLSWLQFNERVLAEAQVETNPLLERTKFLAISSNNLDEFFMIRYASLAKSIQNASKSDKHAAIRLIRIRNNILEAAQRFTHKQSSTLQLLRLQLSTVGIQIENLQTDNPKSIELMRSIFEEDILPKLPAPEQFSPSKLSTLANLQIGVIFPENLWFKIPRGLPLIYSRVNPTTNQLYCFLLDDLILGFIGAAYQLSEVPTLIRLTRDGDFTVDFDEEDTDSVPDIVRMGLGIREKGRPVRLQYRGKSSKNFLNLAMKSLKLSSAQVIHTASTLCLHGLVTLKSHVPESILSKHPLTYTPLLTIIPKPFQDPNRIFEKLDQRDFLLHHPYDSFDAFVAWIRAACLDPRVIQIDQTVYRMDKLSPIIDALKSAAKTKKIRVVIELRARFDELNNLRLAEELRSAGVEVAFGFGKLKVHGKVALVTQIAPDGSTKLYAHLSTGNYNATTARQYTDLAILTSNPDICADVLHFFNHVLEGKVPKDFKALVPAPTKLHRRLINHILGETEAAKAGKKARIIAKVNALIDETVISHLYRASQAGVQVDLIVRGTCSLVPGIKGLSENIRVISIVDRFLEHSRLYYFHNSKMIYLSSADWMPRNFFSRLELAFPVLDSDIYKYIEEFILPIYLSDTAKSRELTSDGKWKRRKQSGVRSQFVFERLAMCSYAGTPLWRRNYGNG